jgi:transcriptional regulator with XRE-family HTH domain
MTQSVSIGDRLREERQRLNLTQPAIGEVGGVTKKTQMLYESGERFPDATYLAALAGAGVDVLYVLTGLRAQSHAVLSAVRQAADLAARLPGSRAEQAEALQAFFDQMQDERPSSEERELLTLYRAASLPVRAAAVGALSAGTPTTPASGKKSIALSNSAAGAVQIGKAGGKVTVRKGR